MAFILQPLSRLVRTLSGGPNSGLQACRYSVAANDDIRGRLTAEVKNAMKNKDSFTSTTLRSVLSEVYAADKASSQRIPPTAIIGILRKATLRRNDSAAQFLKASRPDLADKETREAGILATFLPSLLPASEVDRILEEVITQHPAEDDPRKALGKIFKAFYSRVDRSTVDTDTVKQRAEALLPK